MQTIHISRITHDGRGIGNTAEGKTVFVDGALPGETVNYETTSKRAKFNSAKAIDIVNPAPERVTPKCAYFGVCGGCSLQHIADATQIKLKQSALLEQLEHIGKINLNGVTILPPLTSQQWGYRHKARLGVKYVFKKEKVLVGFREKQKAYLADIDSCEVLHVSVGKIIDQLKIMLATLESYNQIAQLEVACGDNQTALIIRNLVELSETDQKIIIEFAKNNNLEIYLQPKGPDSIYKIWPEDNIERLYYSLPEFDLKIAFHPADFTQVNPEINRKMLVQALGLLDLKPTDTVLDLFCGLGNFSLPMAKSVKQVVGVEGCDKMVARAYENAATNNITNVSFHAANLAIDQHNASWAAQNYTKILLDPPRSGAEEILSLITKIAPEKLVYVSCNPATLARDLGILTQNGYKLTKVGIMDMFPHTSHVESMAELIRK